MAQTKHSQIIALSLGVLAMIFCISIVVSAWTEPSQTPPSGNVPAPINIGPTDQWKEGKLGIGTSARSIYWLTDSGDSLYFQNKDSQTKVTIGYDGNVGIGTTSPQSTLHVNGRTELSRLGLVGTYNSAEVQQIWSIGRAYNIDTTANDFGTSYGITYAHTNAGTDTAKKPIAGWGHQILFTNAGTRNAAISLTSGHGYFAGNVGIGTTSPGAKLEVAGQVKITGGSPGAGKVLTSDASGLSSWQTIGSVPGANYWTQSGSNLYPNNTGWNVGIGTTSPGYKLDVAGGLRAQGSSMIGTGDDRLSLELQGSFHRMAFNELRFYDWQTGEMVTFNNGNVGIGTTGPGYKLHVAGDIYANGGWLRTSGAAGWYSESYGGGWFMQDSTWIRSYGSKPVYMSAGYDSGSPSGVACGGGLGGGYTFQVCGSTRLRDVYADNWFRVWGRTGLYNQDYGTHLYWNDGNYLRLSSNYGMIFNQTTGYDSATAGYIYHDYTGGSFGLLSSDGGWQVRTWNSGVELYDTTYVNTEYGYIWYDRNNSSYYVDPSGTSVLAGNLYLGSSGRVNFLAMRNGTQVLRDDTSTTLHLVPWNGTFNTVCIGCGSPVNLYVSGNFSAPGNVHENCYWSGWDGTGNYFYHVCSNGYYVAGMEQRGQFLNETRIYCCRL